ncbi:MAG: cytochrome c peroxidase [Planctomycetota bacterium]
MLVASCDDDGDGGYGGETLSALNAAVQAPADNPVTDEKAALGRLLFFDPILSAASDVACGTCHIPAFAYADGLALAIGTGGSGVGPDRVPGLEFPNAGRNAPSLLNVAFNGLGVTSEGFWPSRSPMFWDHRIRGLEAQVLEPIRAAAEMRGSSVLEEDAVPEALQRLAAIPEYVDLFDDAFGSPGIDETRLSYALATYIRTLVVRNSPFDRFMRGDEGAMTPQQQRGMEVFDEAECAGCHNGQMFSDWSLKSLGVGPNPDRPGNDEGAGNFRFRSASLRNVELTAPYMHNGTLATLEEVIDFYAAGVSVHPSVSSNDLEPQSISSSDKLALISFLEALTDTGFDHDVPDSVPSGLQVPGSSSLTSFDGSEL